MSAKLISRSPDIRRLRDEGYEITAHGGYLVISSVPYVKASKQICRGTVVSELTMSGDRTAKPADHQVWFIGELPHTHLGKPINAIGPRSVNQALFGDLVASYRFSNKPKAGYADYYEKMSRYIQILGDEARAIDPSVTAKTFKPIASQEPSSVFHYTDTATSRYGLTALADRVAMAKVAIVGLGGTGSFVLDLVAKTPVVEIHIFDGDFLYQHNAFRCPGAVSLDSLNQRPLKVEYYAELYGQLRTGIVQHPYFLDADNIDRLSGFDFVFMCVDRSDVRRLVKDHLNDQSTPFIDTGMSVDIADDTGLVGACRVTLSTPEKSSHFDKRVSLRDSNPADEVYQSNIQLSELNMLSASMAVIKWKKYCGFFQDCYHEHNSVYVINTHQLTRDECV